ncbi:Kinesin-like protein FLA10 [Tetrabaena socialis]|uniref:Kinesin-like protein FLA10 n=1 Tax=Tetrabaena socialis TaxID=47790 RepID=A0A2J8A2R1_9CHLO|nr:Kinesin-like protein FLA10 [Tetrabaena socialis]|eukprot:PNH06807.1 Kinesin-like protein FLA10 [Tetrabaena socialis]
MLNYLVVVRCRPLNGKEKADGRARIVEMDVDAGAVKVRNPKADASEPPKAFTFDQVYDWNCQQRDVFDITARPLIDTSIEGYNGDSDPGDGQTATPRRPGGLAGFYVQFEEAGAGANGRAGKGGATARPGSSAGRPVGSAARRVGNGKPGGKDPTDIGSLRDSVNWGDDDDKKAGALPKAKGLVKDTHDPRLRTKAAK